jgi:hypothetical protein
MIFKANSLALFFFANEMAYCDASTDLSEPSIAINIFEIRLLDVVNEFSSLPKSYSSADVDFHLFK